MTGPGTGAGSGSGSGSGDDEVRQALHVPFRPVAGRRTALVLMVSQAVVLTGVAVLMPSEGVSGFGWSDRLGVILVAAAIASLLWRFAQLSVIVTETGLRVQNLIHSRELDWPQVVAVRFGGGQPWVSLDLADGDTLAVMAVQRADGRHGDVEARRLATLVALHSQTDHDD